jgi:5-methyltetrahydrofolate--homocysteine methyltransferase
MGDGAQAAVRPSFEQLLEERGVLLADGATGTNYQTMGMEPGLAPEEWLFQAPDKVVELHRAFVDAGADMILTCTFGATSLRLSEGPLAGRGHEVNVRAAELAREAAGEHVLVAGSLGPSGQLIEPYGLLGPEAAREAFGEQAAALAEGGVDLLVLETIFAVEEAVWAVEGIREATTLPLVVSFSFDMGTRTMMGLSPTDAAAAVLPLGIAAVGCNCGRSLADADLVVDELLAAAGEVPLWVKPNAGIPKVVGAEVVYEAGPDDLAAHVSRYVAQGARIVGGCCGSTPAHVEALARALGR